MTLGLPFKPASLIFQTINRNPGLPFRLKNQPFNILVADANEAIRSVVSAILRRHGHNVEVVDNGNEAIKIFTLRACLKSNVPKIKQVF